MNVVLKNGLQKTIITDEEIIINRPKKVIKIKDIQGVIFIKATLVLSNRIVINTKQGKWQFAFTNKYIEEGNSVVSWLNERIQKEKVD